MPKSDFKYFIENYAGRDILVIEDMNLGNMSVTNNIENVVDEIVLKEGAHVKNFMIIYRDSGGIFDGFDIKNNVFVFLDKPDWKSAVSRFTDLQIIKR